MDIRQAIVILEYLASGLDPYTGQPLQKDEEIGHPNEQEETIEAFQVAINTLRKVQKEERRHAALPKNTHKIWSQRELDYLLTEYEMGRTIEDIAYHLHRSHSSVRSKLFKLGKIVFEL